MILDFQRITIFLPKCSYPNHLGKISRIETTAYIVAFPRAVFIYEGDNNFAFYISFMMMRTETSGNFSHAILFHFKTGIK